MISSRRQDNGAGEAPPNFGPAGRNGYVFARDGLRGLLLDRINDAFCRWIDPYFTWTRVIVVFVAAMCAMHVTAKLETAHRKAIWTEHRFARKATPSLPVRLDHLFMDDRGRYHRTNRPSYVMKRDESLFISTADYAAFQMRRAAVWSIQVLYIAIIFVALGVASNRLFGKRSTERQDDDAPVRTHDAYAAEARNDWVLNPPKTRKTTGPVFGRS